MLYHWFDMAAGIFLIACVVYSGFRGFIKELFCVLAWIAGYFGAISLHSAVSPFFRKFFKTAILVDLASFFAIFGTLYITVRLLGFVLRRKAGLKHIPPTFDHSAGALMGAAKWVFFLAIFLSPLNLFPEVKGKLLDSSVMAGVVIELSQKIVAAVGTELGDTAKLENKGARRLMESAKKSIKKLPGVSKAMEKTESLSSNNISDKDREEMDELLKSLE